MPTSTAKRSGLEAIDEAAVSWGNFSAIEGETARLVVKVRNRSSGLREIQQGFPEDDLSEQTRVILHFSDARPDQIEAAGTVDHRLASNSSTWLISGWGWTASDLAALESVEIVALTRRPKRGAEVWQATIDEFTGSGSTLKVSGTVKNLFSDGRFTPLISAVFLDTAGRPVTYSVAALTAESVDSLDEAPWTVSETFPASLATKAHSVQVTAASALDAWGTSGDMVRDLREIMDGL